MSSTKRVLIPSYYFPPHGSVGIFRVAKFIEYLPEFGWEPYVVTITDDYYLNTESVHKFPRTFESIERLERITIPGGNLFSRGLGFLTENEPFRANALQSAWVPSLIRKLSEMTRTYDIDVVLGSGDPFIPLIALPMVNIRTETPYVVDFRDPWIQSNENTTGQGLMTKLRNTIARTMEPRVVRQATEVTTVTKRITAQYQERYPKQCNKINTIHNGYDPADFESIEPEPKGRFRITYPGKWYGKEYAQMFLEGFARFVDDHDAELIHYGKITSNIQSLIKKLDLEDHVFPRGYVDRETVAATAKGSDVGLVISRSPEAISTKTFDFIGCNVPILAVCDQNSALDSFVEQFEHGYTVQKGSPEDINSVLRELWEEEPESLGDTNQVSEYTMESLTRELSMLLDRVIDE